MYFPITESTDGHAYAFGQAFLILDGRLQRWQGILRFDANRLPGPHTAAECLVNLATMQPSPIAPGTIMTLLGEQLGPDAGVSFALQNGRHAHSRSREPASPWTECPRRFYYAQREPDQLHRALVSKDRRGQSANLRYDECHQFVLVRRHRPRCSRFVAGKTRKSPRSTRTRPSILPQHPAPGGTYVSVYMTGAGTIENPMVDGGIPLDSICSELRRRPRPPSPTLSSGPSAPSIKLLRLRFYLPGLCPRWCMESKWLS